MGVETRPELQAVRPSPAGRLCRRMSWARGWPRRRDRFQRQHQPPRPAPGAWRLAGLGRRAPGATPIPRPAPTPGPGGPVWRSTPSRSSSGTAHPADLVAGPGLRPPPWPPALSWRRPCPGTRPQVLICAAPPMGNTSVRRACWARACNGERPPARCSSLTSRARPGDRTPAPRWCGCATPQSYGVSPSPGRRHPAGRLRRRRVLAGGGRGLVSPLFRRPSRSWIFPLRAPIPAALADRDYALAGLRLGYGLGTAAMAGALRLTQPPWSVNTPRRQPGRRPGRRGVP